MQLVALDDIQSVVSVTNARQAVHDAFCALAAGSAVAPPELAMKLAHGGELHIKGAYLGGEVLAFKAASGQFPDGGNSGFTSVLDAATGAPVAILDDHGWLTEMRTAAASAVTAVALARPESSRLAILGGGYQAAFQVEAMRDVFELEDVRVWSRSEATRQAFAQANGAKAAATVQAAVVNADIVICCTPSREPLLRHAMIAPGTHVVAMGADMVGKRELAADLTEQCDMLVCDDKAVTAHVGELQHCPHQVGRAVNLGDVLTGSAPRRTASEQITVADLCGLGIQDAAMAQLVMTGLQH